jgi:hypothetical protein
MIQLDICQVGVIATPAGGPDLEACIGRPGHFFSAAERLFHAPFPEILQWPQATRAGL